MKKILVIGDSCTDIFIYGSVKRICPEAPVPVFIPNKIIKNGGMAKNVYENIKSLGVDCDIITNKQIITKTRYVEEYTNQMIIRIDSNENGIRKINKINKINLSKYDAIVISDYNKGFLSYDDIEYICSNHNTVFIDTKKKITDKILKATFIKINEPEYENNINNGVVFDRHLDKLIVTIGNRGCKYKEKIYKVKKVEIKDMSGAGDTFISALSVKYCLTKNIISSIKFANRCATVAVQHRSITKVGEYIKIG